MRSARRPARGLASRPMFDASRRAPWVAAACGLLMASTALADPRVVLDRPLRAGAPGWLWVIPEDGDLERAPEVQVRGGDAEVMPARAGAWPVRVVAQAGVPAVTVDVQTATGQRRVEVPVSGLVVGGLELPERVDATAWAPEISFVVRGEALPPPEALEVVLGEGYVTGVAVDGEALVVSARLDDRVFARVVPFAVRDLRTEDPPVWSEVRVRTRHRLPLETEPGAVAEVTIARRSYGPFAADAEGRLSDVMVDVYPGDDDAPTHLLQVSRDQGRADRTAAEPCVHRLSDRDWSAESKCGNERSGLVSGHAPSLAESLADVDVVHRPRCRQLCETPPSSRH